MPVTNFLLDQKHAVDEAMRKLQSGPVSAYKGKTILRQAKILHVISASRKKGVKLFNGATGATFTLGRSAFISRKIQIVETPAYMKILLDPRPVPERAHDIAISNEIPGPAKIRSLYALRKTADDDGDDEGVQACTYYIGLIKQGKKIKKWSGDND